MERQKPEKWKESISSKLLDEFQSNPQYQAMPKKQASDQGNIHRQEWTQGQRTHPHIQRQRPKRTPYTIAKATVMLGKRYYLFENGKWKLLSQVGGRTLDGRIEDIRSDIVEGETNYATGDADAQLNRFVTLIQKVNEQYLGKNASDNQNDAMADGTLYYEEDPVLAVTDCLESKAISNYSVKMLNLLRSEWLA